MESDPTNYFPTQTIQLFEDYEGYPPPPSNSTPREAISYQNIDIVQEEIGKGGYGVVHKGQIDDIPVAVKEPRTASAQIGEAFNREIELWAGLTSNGSPPFIVDFYDSGKEPQPWLCIEYLSGSTLEAFISEYVEKHRSSLPVDDALWLGIIIACGVEYAHDQGVAHWDLKPDNILCQETGEELPYPKLTDWGLARVPVFAEDDETLLTPYAAPEQLEDERYSAVDQEQGIGIDIYQLGLIIHFLLTGQHPIDTSSRMEMHQRIVQGDIPLPSERNPSLPAGIDPVIMKALAKNRTDRYKNISKLREALENVFRSCVNVDDMRVEFADYSRSGATNTELSSSDGGGERFSLTTSWETTLSEDPVHAPLAVGNRLYYPLTDRVIIINLDTGKRVQEFELGLPISNDELVGISARRQQLYATTKEGRLISVRDNRTIINQDKYDGTNLTSPIILPGREPAFIIVAADAQDDNQKIFRVTADGEITWERQIGKGKKRPTPVFQPERGTMSMVSANGIAKIDVESGNSELYEDCLTPKTNLVAYKDRLYYAGRDIEGYAVVCLDIAESATDWKQIIGQSPKVNGIAVDNEEVVVATAGTPANHGQLTCLERTDGNIRWKRTFGNASVSIPAISSNHVHASLYLDLDVHRDYLQKTDKLSKAITDPQEAFERYKLPEQFDNIRSLQLQTGDTTFAAATPGAVELSVVPRNERLVVSTNGPKCIMFQSG